MSKTFHLELETEFNQVSEVLKSVVHAILFNRLTHLSDMAETTIYGLTYCYYESLTDSVEKAVQSFIQSLNKSENVVTISFQEHKKAEPWEIWTIKLNIHLAETEQQKMKFNNLVKKQLRACLLYIAHVNISETYHIPSLSDPSAKTIHKIIVPAAQDKDCWTGLLKKMISDSSIPAILK